MSIPVILASQSSSRAMLLRQAGIMPTIRNSHVNEDAVLEATATKRGISVAELTVEERVLILARAKAQAVQQEYASVWEAMRSSRGDLVVSRPLDDGFGSVSSTRPLSDVVTDQPGLSGLIHGPIIIGCDSLFTLDSEIYGKPHTPEVAMERLRTMSGNTGKLWTGHVVIDMSTGEMVQAISTAHVTFASFTQDAARSYISTGEPLEVAGSFTLEGIGSAYIESIQGDPSGVMGLSMPTVRSLVEQLGIQWPSLWNAVVVQDTLAREVTPDVPEGNINQPGDGWIDCPCGKKHWGRNNAAGVMLARRNDAGEVTHIAMQHRALWSAEGGTWGVPGGAIAIGENVIEGALRESAEEANFDPADIDVVGAYCEDHGPWGYTTVFAFEKEGHIVRPQSTDDESEEVRWVSLHEMKDITLISSLARDWPNFLQRLRVLAQEYRP